MVNKKVHWMNKKLRISFFMTFIQTVECTSNMWKKCECDDHADTNLSWCDTCITWVDNLMPCFCFLSSVFVVPEQKMATAKWSLSTTMKFVNEITKDDKLWRIWKNLHLNWVWTLWCKKHALNYDRLGFMLIITKNRRCSNHGYETKINSN